jgi:hypothetical protein
MVGGLQTRVWESHESYFIQIIENGCLLKNVAENCKIVNDKAI